MSAKIRFGIYELDPVAMELRKNGIVVRLQEQPFRVLAILAERPGEVITREEMQHQIWGDTFVDFDQSLNKAVNKVREALNDDAGTPRYVETVPRRGYRFIAPVATIPQAHPDQTTTAETSGPILRIEKVGPRRLSETLLFVAVTMMIALAVIGCWIGMRSWQSTKVHFGEAKLITSFGVHPALSRDGKVLAFMSSLGGGTPHIWVQQTAGGEAVAVTTGSDRDFSPDVSPDGTRIVFASARKGGGIYSAPTLPGESRLVAATSGADYPQFSPSGDRILYWQDQKAFTVSIDGGQPIALPVNRNFRLDGPPLWAPSGNAILFYGVRRSDSDKSDDWWIAPLGEGQPKLVHLPGVSENAWPAFAVRVWRRGGDDRESIIYSTANLERWKLWGIGVSPQGVVEEHPELLASGTGKLGPGGSASDGGKLAFNIWQSTGSIYQVPIADRGQDRGLMFQLPLTEGATHFSPSVSRDGKWLAYSSVTIGKPDTILLRNLSTGTDHFLDDQQPNHNGETSISPDGSKVIFERDCKDIQLPASYGPMPCSFIVDAGGGTAQQVCTRCTARGFSSDGSIVLAQRYDQDDINKFRIVALDLHARTESELLSLPDRPVFQPFLSWDDHWLVFTKWQPGDLPPSQVLIARMQRGVAAPKAEWIAVTDGKHEDDKPQFSADGNTVYFTSTRDGNLCIWAQWLDPASKHPQGPPIAVQHFHNSEGRAAVFYQHESDLSVARDKMLINLPKVNSEIWITEIR
jgi:Tol biopolymer transport system component/DNA-binding winged helix-turn-helix (wHTH) protein